MKMDAYLHLLSVIKEAHTFILYYKGTSYLHLLSVIKEPQAKVETREEMVETEEAGILGRTELST